MSMLILSHPVQPSIDKWKRNLQDRLSQRDIHCKFEEELILPGESKYKMPDNSKISIWMVIITDNFLSDGFYKMKLEMVVGRTTKEKCNLYLIPVVCDKLEADPPEYIGILHQLEVDFDKELSSEDLDKIVMIVLGQQTEDKSERDAVAFFMGLSAEDQEKHLDKLHCVQKGKTNSKKSQETQTDESIISRICTWLFIPIAYCKYVWISLDTFVRKILFSKNECKCD